ncbi:MAG: hypothetical protein WD317_03580 [Balneolaceae bacterium]
MYKSTAYRSVVRITALMLLTGFLLPAGLYAGKLAGHCLSAETDGNSSVPVNSMPAHAMSSDHSCCPDDEPDADNTDKFAHHNCGSGMVCACHLSQAPQGNQSGLVPDKILSGLSGIPVSTVIRGPEIRAGSFTKSPVPPDWQHPPIYLLNSTFLN